MKKLFFLIFYSIFLTLNSKSQTNTNPLNNVDVSNMTIPSSPGFVLLDKAPSSIDKPQNPKAFGISLLNLWQGGAVDFTPYWIIPNHPKYTFEKDLNKIFPILQTFDISVATFKTDTSSTLSTGFKTQILRFYHKKTDMLGIKNLIVQELSQSNPKNIDTTKIKKLLDSLTKVQGSHRVFTVELAGAYLGESMSNSFSNLKATNLGLWLNLDYSLCKSLDVLGVARYRRIIGSSSLKNKGDSSYLDLGLSVNLTVKKFSFSTEFIYRTDYVYNTSYNRFAFVAEYSLTNNINLVTSLGKNFQTVNNIIALFGVKFGIGNQNVSL